MQMRGAMSVYMYIVGEGYSEEFEGRSEFTKAQYSACCSSSLCLNPCHESSDRGFPGRTSMPMTLLSSLNPLKNESEDS